MICKYCGQDKPETQFEIANRIKGKEYWRLKCQRCYQDTKNDYRRRKRKWLEEYKKTLYCEDCGNNDHRCLDFHHMEGKVFTVTNGVGAKSKENVLEEIAKCIVLCSNCHRIRHYDDKK